MFPVISYLFVAFVVWILLIAVIGDDLQQLIDYIGNFFHPTDRALKDIRKQAIERCYTRDDY